MDKIDQKPFIQQTLDSEFKENMLLSFYRWPYVENSTIMPKTNKSSSIYMGNDKNENFEFQSIQNTAAHTGTEQNSIKSGRILDSRKRSSKIITER